MSATATLQNKRARFVTDKALQQEHAVTSPSDAAVCAVTSVLSGLGSLRDLQRTFFHELHSEFFKHKLRLKALNERVAILSKEDFIPSSANLKFSIYASDLLREENDAAVTTAQTNCETSIRVMQNAVRKQLLALAKLEIIAVQKAIRGTVARSTASIAATLAIGDPTIDNNQSCDIYQLLFDTVLAGPPLLKHTEFSDVDSLYTRIHEFAVASTPDEAGARPYRHTEERVIYNVTTASPTYVSFKTIFTAIFVTSWDTYETQESVIKAAATMKEFIGTIRASTATATTAMDVDALDLTNPATVEQVIEKRVSASVREETKKLAQQIQKLQSTVSKNGTRGANPPSASLKKKKGSTHPKKPTATARKRQSKPAAKAAAVANDSSKQSATSRKKSQQRRKPSKNNTRK